MSSVSAYVCECVCLLPPSAARRDQEAAVLVGAHPLNLHPLEFLAGSSSARPPPSTRHTAESNETVITKAATEQNMSLYQFTHSYLEKNLKISIKEEGHGGLRAFLCPRLMFSLCICFPPTVQ